VVVKMLKCTKMWSIKMEEQVKEAKYWNGMEWICIFV
jgi:hypothetical protein